MLNDAKYIGLDVHQATISVVVLDGTGHLVMESIIETKAATILDPASFGFCLIGSDTFRADMLHLRGDVLHHCGHSGRKALISQVRWERAGQGLAGGDVELGAVHAASDVLAVERTQFQWRIHVSAASLNGVVSSAAITNHDLAPRKLDRFHPARGDLFGADCADELVTQGPRPLAAVGAGCSGQ